MEKLCGIKISHYEVLTFLWSDLAVAVYVALDLNNDERRLLWTAFPQISTTERFRHDMLEQLNLLSLFEHPNLLPILEVGEQDQLVYWVTPKVDGQELADTILNSRSEREAAALAASIAEGLEYIHKQNALHGNLNPNNVLINSNGQVVLQYYGIASLLEAEARVHLPERMISCGLGKPGYLSPEQITGRECSSQTDLYALGAIYYNMLNGCEPFKAATSAEAAIRAVAKPLEWPKKLRRFSNASIRFVCRCMAKDPYDRFNSSAEARKLLGRIAAGKWAHVTAHKSLMVGAPRRPNWVLRGMLFALVFLGAGWIVLENIQNLAWLLPSATPPPALVEATPLPQNVAGAIAPTRTIQPGKPAPTTQNNVVEKPTAAPTPDVTLTDPPPDPTSTPSAEQMLDEPVLIGTQPPGEQQSIQISNAADLRETIRLGFGKFNQVAFGPGEDRIAVASSAGVLVLEAGSFHSFIDPEDEASSVQFSLDGSILAVGLQSGDIQLWDWKAHRLVNTLHGHTGRVSRILFLSNGKRMLSASYDFHIRMWSFPDGELRDTIAVGGPVKDMAVSADGRYIVSASTSTRRVHVWNAADGGKLHEFAFTDQVEAVAITQVGENTYIAAGDLAGTIREWVLEAKQLRSEDINMRKRIWSLYYTQNGSKLLVGMEGGEIRSVMAGQMMPSSGVHPVKENPGEWRNVFGNEFEFLSHTELGPAGAYATVNWDGKLNIQGGNPISFHPFDIYGNLVFSPDSRYLLAGGGLNNVVLWNAVDNTVQGTTTGRVPSGGAFSASSRNLALVVDATHRSPNGELIPIELLTTRTIDNISSATSLSQFPANAQVRWIMDDRLLVAGNITQTKIWDISTDMETDPNEGNNLGCQVSRSRNNDQVLSVFSWAGMMTEWDERASAVCRITNAWGSGGRLTALSQDRKWLVSYIAAERRLELYDNETGTRIWFKSVPQQITALTIVPGGEMLLTGSPDGSLAFWSIQDGQSINTIQNAHPGEVRAVVGSPDGKMIASSGTDGTVRIWEVRVVQ